MIEVEIKLPIYRRSATERDLRDIGFIPLDLVRESDIYFTSDFHDFMQRDEALRIRTCENLTTGISSTVLTFKGPKIDAVSMTRRELETGVEDEETCRQILLTLGYRELSPVKKLRQYYESTGPVTTGSGKAENSAALETVCHACVDQVESLGSFLELEILVEKESDRENALKKIEAILDDLGYSMNDTTRYSYLYMLQQKSCMTT